MSPVTTSAPAPRLAPTSPTDATEVAGRLRLTATRLARLLRQQADTGLTPTQLSALATLHRCGPIPIGVLAEEEQVAAPTATKIVDKLHQAGYVDRRADPEDRRVTRVALNPAGEALLAEVRARKTAWLAHRLDALDPAELDRVAAAVDVLEHLVAPPAPGSRPAAAPLPSVPDAATTTPPTTKPLP